MRGEWYSIEANIRGLIGIRHANWPASHKEGWILKRVSLAVGWSGQEGTRQAQEEEIVEAWLVVSAAILLPVYIICDHRPDARTCVLLHNQARDLRRAAGQRLHSWLRFGPLARVLFGPMNPTYACKSKKIF